ncbi:potassium channel protein [Candidatus Bathyarchaeota archaeon]|nr:potassium channel protein [Candidatus Bathyarchaeota archaeon]NIV67653.1 potassium channel protein [Candidatus Bathyarchaeota archaeon]NIW16561.1 potassium channel protein [Candidatus Bathyarchaeota archaeon]
MIDLAYSAALFHSRDLAEEVLELEKRVDYLAYVLDMNAMLAARDAEDAESLIAVTKVATATDKISDAAADIATIVLQEIGVHPIVREVFREAEEHLARAEVRRGSTFANKKLGELDLAAEIGVDVIAIRRGRAWIIDPDKEEEIREGDILFTRGAPRGVEELKKLAAEPAANYAKKPLNPIRVKKPFERIARRLTSLKNTSELMVYLSYSSLLLNSRELAEEVQSLEEHVDESHTEFEHLVLSSGFKPEESKNFLGLIRLGIVTEEIADAAAEIADVVLRVSEPHPILKRVIEEAEETVARIRVSPDSSLVGKTLREAQIPEETGLWVLVIRRGKNWLRPRPYTVIKTGDVLISSGYAEGLEDLTRLASVSNEPE